MNNKKIFKIFLPGSALIVSVVLMASIFLIGFTVSYISIVSTSRESGISDFIKAEQLSISGGEKLKFEIISGIIRSDDPCLGAEKPIFSFVNNNSSYIVYCDNSSGENIFYSLGSYKSKKITKEIKIPFICGFSKLNYEGYDYKTVKVLDKCWLAENLRYLPEVFPETDISPEYERFYVYGYNGEDVREAKNTINYNKHGVLYNYLAAKSSCPVGWRLASEIEFLNVVNSFEGERFAGTELKAIEYHGNNNTGLNFLLSGHIYDDYFARIDILSENWLFGPYYFYLDDYEAVSVNVPHLESNGFSVRCIKD